MKNVIFKLIIALCLIAGVMLTACACNVTPTEEPTSEPTEAPTEEVTEAPSETLDPSTANYTVTVVDEFGQPLKGATVQLCVGDLCQLPALTDDNGVVIKNAKKDDYTVKVSLAGYSGEAYYSFPAGSTELTVELSLILGITPEAPAWFTELENEIEVAAGETVYYAGRFSGATMKLFGKDVTVVYNDETYSVQNNMITLEVGEVDNFSPALFAITNAGSVDKTFTVKFIYPEGNINNPAELTIGKNTATIGAESDGYFFTWTANVAGELCLTISEGCDNWAFAINNITAVTYGETHYSTNSASEATDTVSVNVGDEIQIIVGTSDFTEGTVEFDITVG